MMAVLDMFRRGWGWVWLLGAVELALIGAEALPLLQPAPPIRSVPVALAPTDSPARVSLQPILDFQPFGAPDIPEPEVQAETPVVADAPPSPVTEGYVLQGVLFRDDGVPSRAILAWNGGLPASYTAGDRLPSGATLAGVEANRVWLDKDGDTQFLEFPVSGSALQDETGTDLPPDAPSETDLQIETDLPPETDPLTEDDTANQSASPPPNTPTIQQPDLRNLIPGLVATQPSPD